MAPQYASEANLDDPYEMIAWVLGFWPGVGKTQPYPPAPAPIVAEHSKLISDLGFRYHPELAVIKKVPGEDGSPVFIPVDEPDPVVKKPEGGALPDGEALQMLAMLSPDAAQRIAAMSDEERREVLGAQHEDYLNAVQVLKNMKSLFGGE